MTMAWTKLETISARICGTRKGVVKFAFVKGVGAVPITEPRQNLTGDPYFTDGHRAVLWVSDEPIEFEDVEFVEWETPPKR